ncbi:hypothetical protein E2C01_040328 [Portunus trituberculatus]|uniref:Uncharacterized protein n=1 Tax=Portunus trituberculatus TaxID=210409 RepID=A0A5B7FMC9_PORTR|nr:hypothetical protein [Portunus trituberculatus]
MDTSYIPTFSETILRCPRQQRAPGHLQEAFRKITSNSASCTRKSFFLSSSHAPPRRLSSLSPSLTPSLQDPPMPCLPAPPSEAREENGLGEKYEVTQRKVHVGSQPEVGLRRHAGTNDS